MKARPAHSNPANAAPAVIAVTVATAVTVASAHPVRWKLRKTPSRCPLRERYPVTLWTPPRWPHCPTST